MRLSLLADSLDLRAVLSAHPAGLSERVILSRRRSLAEAVDVRPLLDGLRKVIEAQRIIVRAVPQLHFRACAREPGVRVAHQVAPLRRGLCQLASGARRVPRIAARETRERDAGEGRAGFKHVRVGADHDVGHHAAGAVARDEDA